MYKIKKIFCVPHQKKFFLFRFKKQFFTNKQKKKKREIRSNATTRNWQDKNNVFHSHVTSYTTIITVLLVTFYVFIKNMPRLKRAEKNKKNLQKPEKNQCFVYFIFQSGASPYQNSLSPLAISITV